MTKLISLIFFAQTSFAAGLTVAGVNGDVRYSGTQVKTGQDLPAGGTLEVGSAPDAHVDLIYPEGHRLRLKTNARLKIGDAKANPNILELLNGQVFAYFVKGKGAEKFRIRTSSIVAGVRGTKFVVEENSDKGTYVCVCDGMVGVDGINGHSHDGQREVKAGEDLWVHPGKPMEQPKASPGMAKMSADEFKAMGIH
jgi:hypothetical protein